MSWKLLKLTPLKPFFFGKHANFKNTNYARSEYFPQQTQILGALRLYWMEQNKLMKMHKHGRFCTADKSETAKELVGDASSKDFNTNENLGKIDFISPMFILKTIDECIVDAIFEIPCDIVKTDCNYQYAIPKKLNNFLSSKPAIFLENYNVKKGFESGLGGLEFWQDYSKYKNPKTIFLHKDIFKHYDQVGIGLKENKQVNEGQFYTKRSYLLSKGYTFGLLVKIDEDDLEEKDKLTDGIISLGGENSVFSLEICQIPPFFKEHPIMASLTSDNKNSGKKIVLLSDSMLTSSINKDAYYQIVQHKVPFRMMESKIINNKKQQEQSNQKTKEKLLVPKGSIYYFDKPLTLDEANGAYKKIGFNQYLILN